MMTVIDIMMTSIYIYYKFKTIARVMFIIGARRQGWFDCRSDLRLFFIFFLPLCAFSYIYIYIFQKGNQGRRANFFLVKDIDFRALLDSGSL